MKMKEKYLFENVRRVDIEFASSFGGAHRAILALFVEGDFTTDEYRNLGTSWKSSLIGLCNCLLVSIVFFFVFFFSLQEKI